MEESPNVLTHKSNFRKIRKILSRTHLRFVGLDYALYEFLMEEWICQFRPQVMNFTVLKEEIFMTIISNRRTLAKYLDKLIDLGLIEYSPWANENIGARVMLKPLDEDGFNVDTFCEELLKRHQNSETEQAPASEENTSKHQETADTSIHTPTPTSATASEDDRLLVSHLIAKLRKKADDIGVETGKNKNYEIFTKGENFEAAFRILEKMKVRRLGQEVDIGYIENEVERMGNLAKQKLLQTSFNPYMIDVKSNVFGLTERKNRATQVPKKQKQKQIPTHKDKFFNFKNPT